MSDMRSENLRIVIARTLDDVERLRTEWEAVQWHPNSDIDQYVEVLKAAEGEAEPYVMVLKDNSEVRAILIGRIGNISFDIKLGYKTLMRPRVKAMIFIYGGYLGEDSENNCRAFIEQVNARLESGDADLAFFNSPRVDTNLFKVITSLPDRRCRDNTFIKNIHWMMKMPSSIEEFYLSMTAKHRYWLKRIPKVLEKEFPGKVRYKYIKKINEVDCLCKDAENVAQKTYQRSLEVGFKDGAEMRSRMLGLAEKERLRAYIIYVDNKPTAFWIGNRYKETFHLDYTGFDPDYRKYEVGTILFIKMLEDLADNNDGMIKNIDFGLGDAQYKQRFGDRNWEEATIYIFAPTLRGVVLNMIRTGNSLAWKVAEKTLDKWKLKEVLKRKWRRKLIEKKTNEEN